MPSPSFLLRRLDAIAASLAVRPGTLALIGLGSVGQALDRLDRYSDLDFFVLARPEHKPRLLADLSWLSDAHPVAFHFQNTPDGHKLLFADGVFCEFAIFTLAEYKNAAYTGARVVWRHVEAPDDLELPSGSPAAVPEPETSWLVNEALTNLYVGLGRWRRGERLSATRFIQGYAVDRLVALAERIEPAGSDERDVFGPERRVERRLPAFAQRLPAFLPGYEECPDAARAVLAYLDTHFDVPPALKAAIVALLDGQP